MQSDTELAYAAGILDGEGSISIGKQKRKNGNYSMVVKVNIANTNKQLIDWLLGKFGGCCYTSRKASETRRVLYAWQLVSREAVSFIKLVQPYLIIKRKRADIAIFLQKLKNSWGRVLHDDQRELEQALKDLLEGDEMNRSSKLKER